MADLKEGELTGVSKLYPGVKQLLGFKTASRATGVAGLTSGYFGFGVSLYSFMMKPTLGNYLKVIWDGGMVKAHWAVGLADGVWDMSGKKDRFFEKLGSWLATPSDIQLFPEEPCKD